MRIGFGYDVHEFSHKRDFILGGIKIEHIFGLKGHSDADVLIHALMDALLGALSLGDIGGHFPPSDEKYKDIDSTILLERVYELVKNEGWQLSNADMTIVAQNPKLAPYIYQMREKISIILNTNIKNISIKATTEERLGFTGREEGVKAYAVCLLKELER